MSDDAVDRTFLGTLAGVKQQADVRVAAAKQQADVEVAAAKQQADAVHCRTLEAKILEQKHIMHEENMLLYEKKAAEFDKEKHIMHEKNHALETKLADDIKKKDADAN